MRNLVTLLALVAMTLTLSCSQESLLQAELKSRKIETPQGPLEPEVWGVSASGGGQERNRLAIEHVVKRVEGMAKALGHRVEVQRSEASVAFRFPELEPPYQKAYAKLMTVPGRLCVRRLVPDVLQEKMFQGLTKGEFRRDADGAIVPLSLQAQASFKARQASVASEHYVVFGSQEMPRHVKNRDDMGYFRGQRRFYMMSPTCELTSSHITKADISTDVIVNNHVLMLVLSKAGSETLFKITTDLVDKSLLITDGASILSAALVREPVPGPQLMLPVSNDLFPSSFESLFHLHIYQFALRHAYPKEVTLLVEPPA